MYMITDTLANNTEFDDHVKNYNQFRKYVINKLFRPAMIGSRMVTAPSLAVIKTSIDVVDKLFGEDAKPEDVKTIYLEIITTFNELAEIKKYIDDSKTIIDDVNDDFPKIAERLDKIQIPHTVANIRNVVYVVRHGTLDWVKSTNNQTDFTQTVNGIYRFTLTTHVADNFKIRNKYGGTGEDQTAISTITQRIDANSTWTIFI